MSGKRKRVVETWKGKRVFVARDDKGRLISWRRVAGSGLTKDQALQIFRENRTFYQDIKRDKEYLTNLVEKRVSSPTSINQRDKKPILSKPDGITVQYFVSGYYNRHHIVVRSNKITGPAGITTGRQAKQQAWERFLEQLHWYATGMKMTEKGFKKFYDSDEGINYIDQVRNLREGWVYYDKIRNRGRTKKKS